MTIVTLALGGNLGDVPACLSHALTLLNRRQLAAVLRTSRLYATRPIGPRAGGRFINAVTILETNISPAEFLSALQMIENELGRSRDGHWQPRPIDLDILAWGEEAIETATLNIPHPACWYRRFVLDPWNDVDPEWRHPRLNETVRAMRERLLARPLRVGVLSHDAEWNAAVTSTIQKEFPRASVEVQDHADDSPIPEITFAPLAAKGALRCIGLGPLPAAVSAVGAILNAALDEPAPVLVQPFP
jgi:2-amino-4-hydroxy-6-hydroxymethyldihydropteridine diphosphokinase